GQVMSEVHKRLVPNCAPAIEYVAMPDGSSSAAPVISPGPRLPQNFCRKFGSRRSAIDMRILDGNLGRPMTREELLASIPVFESLTPDDLRALSGRLEQTESAEGDVIFRQGDEGSSLFIIDDGAVEIAYGEGKSRIVLATLFAGQYFGELSLFDRAPRSATATATKRSRLIRLDRDDLVDFVNKN